MGKRVTLFDDLDESLDADDTITFALEGQSYQIDLNQKNIDKLTALLEPFIAVAERVDRVHPARSSSNAPKRPSRPRTRTANPELEAIRFWAGRNGFEVSHKGRIPDAVQAAYDKAHAPLADRMAEVDEPPAPAKVTRRSAPKADVLEFSAAT